MILILSGNNHRLLNISKYGYDRDLNRGDKVIFGETFGLSCIIDSAQRLNQEVYLATELDEITAQMDRAHLIICEESELKRYQFLLDPPTQHKVHLFSYWQIQEDYVFDEERRLGTDQVLVPFNYVSEHNNFFIGLFPRRIIAATEKPYLSSTYRGCIWGKSSSTGFNHQLLELCASRGVHFYATCQEEITHANVNNLGVLKQRQFQGLLNSTRFTMGFGQPFAGPTILESLFWGNFLVCPRGQLPRELHDNPNILLTDGLSDEQIVEVLLEIISGDRVFDRSAYPPAFTRVEHQKRLERLLASVEPPG